MAYLVGWMVICSRGHEWADEGDGEVSRGNGDYVDGEIMHYLDQSTFFAVLRDAWNRCEALDGMDYDQLEAALSPRSDKWHTILSYSVYSKSFWSDFPKRIG